MTVPGSRFFPILVLATLTAIVAAMLFGPSIWPGRPGPTSGVAAFTAEPPAPTGASSSATSPPGSPDGVASPGSESTAGPPAPSEPPGASEPPGTGVVPGAVNRSSLDLSATYDVNAEINVGSGVLDVATTIVVRNDADESIDRLELNTIAARLGRLRVTESTVDGVAVKVRVDDQTLIVPLGGVLEPGASTTVRVAYRATLTNGVTGSDWMFTRYGGTLALYRWIPWISRELPFDRPNKGDPFMTVSSPQVSVEILTDQRLDLAAPATDVAEFEAGSGMAWAFTVHDVRDVSVLLAPDFVMAENKVGDVTVRAYARGSAVTADRLLSLTSAALRRESERLGVGYPWPALVAVETQGGEALESPGLVWIPRSLDTLNRTYLVYHEVAHQWFYGMVGNDQRNQPFVDEAAADMLTRTVLDSFRATRCGREALDGSIARYAGRCYYEVIYVQGGLLLDDIRGRMGTKRFWEAIGDYLEEHRFGLATTRDLLEALEGGSEVNLKPILRERFPSLY